MVSLKSKKKSGRKKMNDEVEDDRGGFLTRVPQLFDAKKQQILSQNFESRKIREKFRRALYS